jgi:hypothetical protein
MTTTQEKAAGVGPTNMYKGKLIPFMPWGGEDVALMRSRVRASQPDPLEGLQERIKDLNVEVQKAVALQAYEDRKRLGQLNTPAAREYFFTDAGMAFLLWLSIRQTLPQETEEEVLAWFKEQQKELRERILEQIQEASGFGNSLDMVEELSKNSRSRRRQKARKSSTGNTSTGSSPKDIRGRRRELLSGLPTLSS